MWVTGVRKCNIWQAKNGAFTLRSIRSINLHTESGNLNCKKSNRLWSSYFMMSHSLFLAHLYSHKTVIHAVVKDSENEMSHLDFFHCPLSKTKVKHNFLGTLLSLLSEKGNTYPAGSYRKSCSHPFRFLCQA